MFMYMFVVFGKFQLNIFSPLLLHLVCVFERKKRETEEREREKEWKNANRWKLKRIANVFEACKFLTWFVCVRSFLLSLERKQFQVISTLFSSPLVAWDLIFLGQRSLFWMISLTKVSSLPNLIYFVFSLPLSLSFVVHEYVTSELVQKSQNESLDSKLMYNFFECLQLQ